MKIIDRLIPATVSIKVASDLGDRVELVLKVGNSTIPHYRDDDAFQKLEEHLARQLNLPRNQVTVAPAEDDAFVNIAVSCLPDEMQPLLQETLDSYLAHLKSEEHRGR